MTHNVVFHMFASTVCLCGHPPTVIPMCNRSRFSLVALSAEYPMCYLRQF